MREANGHISVNETAPTERFNHYVEEQIATWIQSHDSQALSASATTPEYEVAFFDEEAIGEISCLVVIHINDQLWRAWETAENPRAALARTLGALSVDDAATDAQSLTH